MAVWTLKYADETKTFAEWGLKGLKRTQVSQAVGGVSFAQSGAAYDGTPLFAADALVTISKDGVPWHVGPVVVVPREATPRSESLVYQVADMGWYLERLPYEQSIIMGAGSTVTPTTRIALFADVVDGATVKSSAEVVIASVIALAVTAGAPMQVSFAGDFGVSPPICDMRDPSCAEVIRQVLRWVPDVTAGWDYNTEPPTLRLATRAAATARTIDLADKASVNLINITARDDIRLDRVVLNYEVTTTDDNDTWTDLVVDAAGSGSPFRTLKATLPLSGPQTQRQKQYLETEEISEESTSWWQKRVATLKDVTDLTITDAEMAPAEEGGGSFDMAIIDGQVPGWMDDPEDPASGSMRVSAKASYKVTGEGGQVREYKDDPVSVTLSCTYLSSGIYSRVTSYTAGEAVPVGVASALLTALGNLWHEGQVKISKRECSFVARPGDVLLLLNGEESWATARMQVQKVDEDVDGGKTTITFGPPKHLSPQDFMEMLRTLRGRPPVQNLDERATGRKGAGNDAKGGRSSANSNGNPAAANWWRAIIKNPDGVEELEINARTGLKMTSSAGSIDHQTEQVQSVYIDSEANRAGVKPTEMSILDADGNGVTLTKDGLVITQDGKTTVYGLNHITMDNGDGKTNAITHTGMILADGDKSTQYELNHVLMADGEGKTLLINEEQMVIADGEGKQGIYEAASARVSDGDKSGELTPVQLELALGADYARMTIADGFKNAKGAGRAQIGAEAGVLLTGTATGTVSIVPVAGKDVSIQASDWCETVAGVPTNKTALIVRSNSY